MFLYGWCKCDIR